jgi:hypothetical protein
VLNKTHPQPGDAVSAFLCSFLDNHGVKPVKVLKNAGLRHETPVDWHSGDVVQALYMASQSFMPQTLHTDSEAAASSHVPLYSVVESTSTQRVYGLRLIFVLLL